MKYLVKASIGCFQEDSMMICASVDTLAPSEAKGKPSHLKRLRTEPTLGHSPSRKR